MTVKTRKVAKAIPMYFGDVGGEKVYANKILMMEGKVVLEENFFFQISQAEIELEEVERHEKKEVMGEDAAEYFEEEFEEYMEFNKKFAGRKTGFGNLLLRRLKIQKLSNKTHLDKR